MLAGVNSYYACVKYEKLILFCFTCGKLRHGESFSLIRVRLEPGWDATLQATMRGG